MSTGEVTEAEHAPHDPLAQFEIEAIAPMNIGGIDISFTNSTLSMVIVLVLILIFILGGIRKKSLVPSRWQSMTELTYDFVASMVKDNVGSEGRAYFPFIFSLFMFILFCNLVGMSPIPHTFTVTSHIIVTFTLALFIFLSVTIIGFMKHGLGFLGLFLPQGTPWWLVWLIVPIEIFSYFVRPVSLSIRLAANMMAGHLLLKVIAGFVIAMGVFGIFPLAFMVMMVGFEFFVALLQAYIFTILTCVYLNDAIHMH